MDLVDLSLTPTSELTDFIKAATSLTEQLICDLKAYTHDVDEFWPDGFDEFPDIQIAAAYGPVVIDLVGGAGAMLMRAKLVRAELENRKYPN